MTRKARERPELAKAKLTIAENLKFLEHFDTNGAIRRYLVSTCLPDDRSAVQRKVLVYYPTALPIQTSGCSLLHL